LHIDIRQFLGAVPWGLVYFLICVALGVLDVTRRERPVVAKVSFALAASLAFYGVAERYTEIHSRIGELGSAGILLGLFILITILLIASLRWVGKSGANNVARLLPQHDALMDLFHVAAGRPLTVDQILFLTPESKILKDADKGLVLMLLARLEHRGYIDEVRRPNGPAAYVLRTPGNLYNEKRYAKYLSR
jgi:hypothetical protein